MTAVGSPNWKTDSAGIAAVLRNPQTSTNVSIVLIAISDVAYVLLLLAFVRQKDDGSAVDSEIPVSRLLRVITKPAPIAYGLWVAFNLIRLVVTPFFYFQLRDAALRIGRRPPQLGAMMLDIIRTLVSQACLFIGPYLIYNAQSADGEVPS